MYEEIISDMKTKLDFNFYVKQRTVDRLIRNLHNDDFERKKLAVDNLFEIANKLVEVYNDYHKRFKNLILKMADMSKEESISNRITAFKAMETIAPTLKNMKEIHDKFWEEVKIFFENVLLPATVDLLKHEKEGKILDSVIRGIPILTNIDNKDKLKVLLPVFDQVEVVDLEYLME